MTSSDRVGEPKPSNNVIPDKTSEKLIEQLTQDLEKMR